MSSEGKPLVHDSFAPRDHVIQQIVHERMLIRLMSNMSASSPLRDVSRKIIIGMAL